MSLVSRIGIKWVALAAIAGMLFAVSVASAAPPPNEMSVTGPVAAQALGVPFNVDVSVSDGSIPYDTYMYELDWNAADLAFAGTVDQTPAQGAGYTLSQTPSPIPGGIVSGGASAAGPLAYTGTVESVGLVCLTAGVHPLTLKAYSAPPPAGTSTLDSTLGNPVIPTALVNGTVTCEIQSDLVITKTGPSTAVAGSTITYVLTMTNNGPNPAPAPIIADMVPPEKIVVGTPGVVVGSPPVVPFPAGAVSTVDGGADPLRCFWFATFTYPGLGTFQNVVLCDYSTLLVPGTSPAYMLNPAALPAPHTFQVTIQVLVPLSDAGNTNVNIGFSGDLAASDPNPADIGCTGIPGIPPTPDNSIACLVTQVSPAVMTISKVGAPNPIVAGSSITWTITAHNAGPSPASGVVITDVVGAGQVGPLANATITGGACTEAGGIPALAFPNVTCTLAGPVAAGSDVVITFDAPVDPNLSSAMACTDASHVVWVGPTQPSADGPGSVQCNPASSFLGIDKGVSAYKVPVVLTVGQSAIVNITEQIEVQQTGALPVTSHTWDAATPAGDGVSLLWQAQAGDTVTPPGFTDGNTKDVFDHNWDSVAPGLYTISRGLAVECTAENATGTTVDLSLRFREQGNVTVTSLGSFQVYCVGAPAQVKSPSSAVLWIMRHPNCLNPVTGEYDVGPCANSPIGWLKIDELGTNVTDVDSPNDADTFPEGLGAFEFQIKFDEKIFDLEIVPGPFLGSTGRTPICNMTVVTENWILFGCVSTGDPNAGPANAGPVTLATINVYPKNDLYLRMRPTKDNGIVRTLIDENCEWADTYGTPLPGMVDGGHVPVCGSATITIRMLEGDLNLDCNVDVLDDQAIAFRYGSSFGLLLYDPWYDLEPMTGDFDVDIKDLQFVFGRNGSTCTNPIPSGQGPMAPPPGGDPPLPPR